MKFASRSAACLLLLIAAACSDSGTESAPPGVTIALASSAANVTQGRTATVGVTLTRTSFSGSVNLSVENLPTGVTATFNPGSVPGNVNASTLTLEASSTAVPATTAVTVKVSGTGIDAQSTQLSLTVNVAGNYTLSVAPASVTIAQGASNQAAATLVRVDGFSGPVALSLANAPTGLTATLEPSSVSGNSSAVLLSAASNTAVGTYTLSLVGTTPGLANQTATLTVRVIAPPPTTAISFDYCPNDTPVWFAVQNEGSSWVRVTPTSTQTFNFNATEKVGIAYVFQSGGESSLIIIYSTAADLAATSGGTCVEDSGTKSYTGSFAGVTSPQVATLWMGPGGVRQGSTSTAFTIGGLPDGPIDLVATRGAVTQLSETPDRFIIRRAVNQPAASALPVLDFSSAESFAPATATLTITGLLAGDVPDVATLLLTPNVTSATLAVPQPSGNTATLYGLPADKLVQGDMIETDVIAITQTELRGVISYYRNTTDRTAAIGPLLATANVAPVTNTPYTRVRAQMPSQSDYSSAALFEMEQGTRYVALFVTSGYLGSTPATWDITEPDLSRVAGFQTSWGLGTGSVRLLSRAYGGRSALALGAPASDGEVLKLAVRVSSFTANLLEPPIMSRIQLDARARRRLQNPFSPFASFRILR